MKKSSKLKKWLAENLKNTLCSPYIKMILNTYFDATWYDFGHFVKFSKKKKLEVQIFLNLLKGGALKYTGRPFWTYRIF